MAAFGISKAKVAVNISVKIIPLLLALFIALPPLFDTWTAKWVWRKKERHFPPT
jgi:hypothetical protein